MTAEERESTIADRLRDAASNAKIVFFAGLPGVGKSWLVQQQVRLAASLGRSIHLLQWDTAREAFETPEALARYPETDGITHPVIRRAVGVWARRAVQDWAEQADASSILIGELPVVGDRFVELTEPVDDNVEPLLASRKTLFFVPVPSEPVRAEIEVRRARSLANPRHQRECRDANVALLELSWQAVRTFIADREPAGEAASSAAYCARDYRNAYIHILRHRQCVPLAVNEIINIAGSVYQLEVDVREIRAGPAEAAAVLEMVGLSASADAHAGERWRNV